MKLSTSFRIQVLAAAPAFPMVGYIAAREQSAWMMLLLCVAAFLCGRLWQVTWEMEQAEKVEKDQDP